MERPQVARLLAFAMVSLFGLHALLLIGFHNAVSASRMLTAAMPMVAGMCCLWRARRLELQDRPTWRWASAGMFLYGLAQLVEVYVGHSAAASNLAVDPSDYIYLAATFPLLLALSTTRETASLRAVFALNCVQIALALVLSYVLLYRMSMNAEAASTVMGEIYGVACFLLAVMAGLRVLTWVTEEEQQSVLWMCIVLWTYLPVELGMDYASAHWNLRAGSLADLFWSVPFFLGGWKALHLPVAAPILRSRPGTRRLLAEALCPMLITAGIFVLAASVIRQHPTLGMGAILLLLSIQAFQSALVQMNYLSGRNRLLEREQDLRLANEALQRLSLEDPLTRIPNRRHFDAALENAWRRAIRRQQPIALLMVDVDFFKGVNDLHGHTYGDECLVSIAEVMRLLARRPDDVVARIGGEEFVLLLPDTDAKGAGTVAGRLHDSIRGLGVVNHASPFERRLTVSIGVCAAEPLPGTDFVALVQEADKALYEAKGAGRNATCTRALI
jgi:diguanylate cyclase (GGDEF)-like protein